MSEKEFTPQQSLALINEMINQVKHRYSEDGAMYLLWGWLVFACSVTQFVLVHFVRFERHYLVWMLTWLAVIYQLFYFNRKRRQRRVKTYTNHIVSFVWLTFVILLFLVGFLIGRLQGDPALYYSIVNPCLLALYGMPTFLTGIIIRFKPLVAGGIGCWILSIIAPFIYWDYQLLLVSVAMVIAWIIPGHLLRSRYKKATRYDA